MLTQAIVRTMNVMANERLSSSITTLFKYVLLPWVVAGALVSSILSFARASPWSLVMSAMMLGISFVVLFFFGRLLWRCQRVMATDTGLRVGSRGAERDIPYSDIAEVRSTRWWKPAMITVELKTGARIVFLARYEFSFSIAPHPVAAQLRERAQLAMKHA